MITSEFGARRGRWRHKQGLPAHDQRQHRQALASRRNGRQVARTRDHRRQGSYGKECAQARPARALETLVRYRGSVLTELFRALGALRLLQAEARDFPECAPPDAAPALLPPPRATTKQTRKVVAKQSIGCRAGA
jgi:hypothetical protein